MHGRIVKDAVAGRIHKGYVKITIDGEEYKRSHLVWLLHTGYWPNEIDHWDRDKRNDRFGNLRDVTHLINQHNRASFGNVGIKGVTYKPEVRYRPFQVSITYNRRLVHRSYHSTMEEAGAVAKEVYQKLGIPHN